MSRNDPTASVGDIASMGSHAPDSVAPIHVPSVEAPSSSREAIAAASAHAEHFEPTFSNDDDPHDARHALVSLIDQAVFAITTFGTGVVIGRLLLETQFSVYYLAMTMIIVMRNVQSELVTAPYSVYRQRYRGVERTQYAGSVIQHQVVIALLGIVPVLVMLVASWTGWVSPGLTSTLLVLLAVTPFLLVRSFLRAFSFASYRFWAAVWIDLTVGAVQFVGILSLWAVGRLSVPAAYAVMGLACVAGILVWLGTKPEPLSFNVRRFWPDWKDNWAFSRWALASQLTGTTSPYLVPWLLEASHGGSATGVYGACFTVVGLSLHFVTAIANYLTPRAAAAFAEEGSAGLLRILRKSMLVYLAVIGGICLGFVVLGDWPVRFIYGDSFGDCRLTCILLAGFTLTISMSVVCGNGLWAVNRPEANLWADIATMVITLSAAAWLIPLAGRDGAAGAMLIGAGCGALLRWVALQRVLANLQTDHAIA